MSAVKTEHVKTTIRSLTTRAHINDLTFRPINPPLQLRVKNVLLTLAVNSPFIRKFTNLTKVNWQLSN